MASNDEETQPSLGSNTVTIPTALFALNDGIVKLRLPAGSRFIASEDGSELTIVAAEVPPGHRAIFSGLISRLLPRRTTH